MEWPELKVQILALPLAQWLHCFPCLQLLLHQHVAAIAVPLPVVVDAVSAVDEFWNAVSSSHAIETHVHTYCIGTGDGLYVWLNASLCYQDMQKLFHRYYTNMVSLLCADACELWGGLCGRMSSHKSHSWEGVQSCAQPSGVYSKLKNLQMTSHKLSTRMVSHL